MQLFAGNIVSKHLKYGGKTPLTNLDEAFEYLQRITEDLGKKGADNVYGIECRY